MAVWKNPELRRALLVCALLTAAFCGAAAFFSLWASLLMLGAGVSFAVVLVLFSRKRYRAMAELSASIDRILHGEDGVSIDGSTEGELSILSSEVRKMTVRLREQAEHLRQDRLRMSDALADISHQLRTPLTAMNLTVSMLSRDGLTAEERRRSMFDLKQQLSRIDWLVETLLKLSKIDAGTVQFRQDWVSVAELLRLAAEPLRIAMELRGQELILGVGEESFTGDLAWSAEAVGNLLKNCSEHTPPGGRIEVAVRQTALFCEILIRDTGEGFAEHEIPFLFDRFYRGENASAGSVGIGLALARSLIVSQNGTVSAANAKEGGATFTVRFYQGVV